MTKNHDSEAERAHLERINEELNASLERCRDLLKTCRTQLAANSNEEDDGSSDESNDLSA